MMSPAAAAPKKYHNSTLSSGIIPISVFNA